MSLENGDHARTTMEACIEDMRTWMSSNFLKLNDGKTEFLVISKRSVAKKVAHRLIMIGSSVIPSAPKAENIECFIDATLSMDTQVNYLTQCCYARLRQIGSIRNYLTEGTAATLVHAQITSSLDNFNAVLIGLSDELLDKTQMIQSNAA